MGATEDSKALMWRITEEIWNNGRVEFVDEFIAEDLIDHLEVPGLEVRGRALSGNRGDDTCSVP